MGGRDAHPQVVARSQLALRFQQQPAGGQVPAQGHRLAAFAADGDRGVELHADEVALLAVVVLDGLHGLILMVRAMGGRLAILAIIVKVYTVRTGSDGQRRIFRQRSTA
ncbi:hypothetical protein A7981_11660 [Methylovorus sp. MM2]|nr:hypothetical protein A7981_11660 [Methylovorus sp. MM2]